MRRKQVIKKSKNIKTIHIWILIRCIKGSNFISWKCSWARDMLQPGLRALSNPNFTFSNHIFQHYSPRISFPCIYHNNWLQLHRNCFLRKAVPFSLQPHSNETERWKAINWLQIGCSTPLRNSLSRTINYCHYFCFNQYNLQSGELVCTKYLKG